MASFYSYKEVKRILTLLTFYDTLLEAYYSDVILHCTRKFFCQKLYIETFVYNIKYLAYLRNIFY